MDPRIAQAQRKLRAPMQVFLGQFGTAVHGKLEPPKRQSTMSEAKAVAQQRHRCLPDPSLALGHLQGALQLLCGFPGQRGLLKSQRLNKIREFAGHQIACIRHAFAQ